MKIKLLTSFIISFVTICGTLFLLKITYNDMVSFSKEAENNISAININGKPPRINQPKDFEPADMTAEVHSSNGQVEKVQTGIFPTPEPVFFGSVATEQKTTTSTMGGDTDAISIVNIPSGGSRVSGGDSFNTNLSGKSTNGNNKGSQPFDQLEEGGSSLTNPSDGDDNDELISYVLVGEGFWILMSFLAVYVVWKIKRRNSFK